MKQTVSLIQLARRNTSLVLAAIVLGIGLGLFVSGYWLVDYFPVESKQLLIVTLGTAVLGALGYFYLLIWFRNRLSELSTSQRWILLGLSIVLGAFFFFSGTDQWLSSDKYVTFFLPSHTLKISTSGPLTIPGAPSTQGRGAAIQWFNTSLGDVSYEAIAYRGWKRVGDELVLQDPQNNTLTWRGKVGDEAEIVFSGVPTNQQIFISWDGQSEILRSSPGKSTYTHPFEVPFYASRYLIFLLGWTNFAILTSAFALILWQKRSQLTERISNSTGEAQGRFGILDMAFVLGLIAAAILMRIFNLSNLYPAVDEYYHLIAARQILQGTALSSVYPRSLWLVTLPISLTLRIFGNQLWAARLIGVVFNVAAVVPLYLITRKINRAVALLSCLLYATSPWIVTFARIAREYAYYPFYFYLTLFAMVTFIEGIPQEFVFIREWRRMLTVRMAAAGIYLLLIPIFALTVDWLSTFRTILIAYPLFGLFVLLRFKLRDRLNFPVLAILGTATVFGGYELFRGQLSKLLPYPRLNSIPLEYFFPNPQQQWYFNRAVIVIAIGLVGTVLLSLSIRRLNFVPIFFLVLYLSSLGLFAFFSREFFHTRHLSTTELWYVVIVAIGIYVVWQVLHVFWPWNGQMANILMTVILGISVLNVQQIVLPIVSTNPDMPISEDYLHDMSLVHAFMMNHAKPDDILISTVYGLYVSWQGEPIFQSQYRINTQTPKEYIISIVSQHPSGWIVIDKIRLSLSSMTSRDLSGIDQIAFVGLFGDEYVWHWDSNLGQASTTEVMERGR